MSAATVTRHVERVITNEDGGTIRVQPRQDGRISVAWFCGEARTFTPEDLRAAIKHLDAVEEFPDVWATIKDSHGHAVSVRIADGDLYADTAPSGHARHIDWPTLRKQLKKALR